ncbi:MAG: EAL domain-containing protein [Pseudomonadota bacterium]
MDYIAYILQSNIDAVFAFYGCAFIFLGLVISLQPKTPNTFSLAAELHLIGYFGYLHGVSELLVIVEMYQPESVAISWGVVVLQWISYSVLFEFSRRAMLQFSAIPRKIAGLDSAIAIYGVALLIAVSGTLVSADKVHALSAMSRYLFAFPGATIAGYALRRSLLLSALVTSVRGVRWAATSLALAFGCYGILAGLITVRVADFPVWLPTQDDFLFYFELPIPVFRALCALVIGVTLTYIIYSLITALSEKEKNTRLELEGLAATLDARVKQRTLALTLEIEKHKKTALDLKISEQHQQKLTLAAQRDQQHVRALLSAMNIGILFEDKTKHIVYTNPAFETMWEIPRGVVLAGLHTKDVLKSAAKTFLDEEFALHHVFMVTQLDRVELAFSSRQTFVQTSHPVHDLDGGLIGRLWMFEDTTEEMRMAQRLIYLAERDVLTGLFNRHRFQEQLDHQINMLKRNNGKCSVLYLGLDEFKIINDTLGHSTGDHILTRAANQLVSITRASDFVARVGGDEFGIITTSVAEDAINALVTRVIEAMSTLKISVEDTDVNIAVSVGIAKYPAHGQNAEELIAHAGIAMHQAKTQGKNSYAIYNPNKDHSIHTKERLLWNKTLDQAFEKEFFTLHFQGVYHAKDLSISHLEALIRLQDAQDPTKLIMPSQFIHFAEKSRQILDIDKWVVRNVIKQLKEYPQIDGIAVNVSGRTFDDQQVPIYIQEQLKYFGVAAERLIIELTETAAVSDLRDAQFFVEALQVTGCRIFLDDFGSGFSTFTYLKHLYVDSIKIDGQFIRDLDKNTDNIAFVSAMIGIARSLKKSVVVEFVENAEILELVRDMGVDMVQGYHLSRPGVLAQYLEPVKPKQK